MTLTLTSGQKTSSPMSASLGGGDWPPGWAAQFTRMSTPLSSAMALSTIALTDSSEPVSHGIAMTRPPVSAASSLALASRSLGLRATTATLTPSAASSRATALPMPRLPPVTMALFPLSSRSMAGECTGRVPPVPHHDVALPV